MCWRKRPLRNAWGIPNIMKLSLLKESKLLARHSIIYGIGNVFNRVAALLLLPVYTRFLTPHDYGIKELVGLSTDVVSILLATAISGAIYRFYFEYDDLRDRNEVISSSIITIGSFGFVAVLLLFLSTKTMAKYILNSSSLYHFFMISFVSLWFQSLNQIGYNYLRAKQQSLKFIILSFGKLSFAISINIYLVCFVKLGVLGILISNLITSIVLFFVLIVPLMFEIGFHFSSEKIKEMLKFGIPLIPSQFGAFIVHLSDRFFIKGYCSIADAGLYSLGYRFGGLSSSFISEPFNQTFQPRRFELYKKEDSEKIFGKIFTYFLFLMFFAGLYISVLTKEVLMIMADKQFWPAYQVVPIIVLAITIFSFHYHLNMGILIEKKTKYLAYINFSNGIFILFLNFLLIPRYGIYGAAYATLIAFIYKVTLTYFFSSRYYKVYFEFIRIVKILIASTLIFVSGYFVQYDSVYLSFFMKFLIVSLYPLLLFGLGFFNKDEKKKALYYFNKTLKKNRDSINVESI